jgi:hypothetical protein
MRIPKFFIALLSAALAGSLARAETVFIDTFANNDVRSADSQRNFWTVIQPPDNTHSQASEKNGRLSLLASTRSYTSVSLAGAKTAAFGFFTRPLTITVDDIQLEAQALPENEARFRISLASATTTGELADNVITLRVRSGLLLMGYRSDGFELSSPPETLAGQRVNSVAVMPLKGVPTRISLTLGPAQREGFVRYEITAIDNGETLRSNGVIPLTLQQWGGEDAASLVLDARRDSDATIPDSHAKFSAGQVSVTR